MLRLRPYEENDAKEIVTWLTDEVTFRQWCADRYDTYPITAEDMNRHYKKYANKVDFFPFTAVDDSGVVGHLILRYTDEEKTVCRLGFVIIDNQRRGCGYGKKMLELAIQTAFEDYYAKKVTLGVFRNNPAAYQCYRSAGFCECINTNPECYQVLGEVWDSIEMEFVADVPRG